MAEHETPVEKVVEVKVIVAALFALFCSIAVAVLNGLQEKPDLIAGLPAWAQFVILTAVPPIATFLSGYRTTSNRV